jgi:hypothetical protein
MCAGMSRSGAKRGDGHDTTLVVMEAGLLAIGIEPVVVKTRVPRCGVANAEPEVKHPTLRSGTKQALLISMLQLPQGISIREIVAADGVAGSGYQCRKAPRG